MLDAYISNPHGPKYLKLNAIITQNNQKQNLYISPQQSKIVPHGEKYQKHKQKGILFNRFSLPKRGGNPTF